MRILLAVTLVLSLLAIVNANSLATDDFSGIIAGDVSKGAIRVYSFTSILGSFTVSGNSVYGNIQQGSANIEIDSNQFVFTGNNACGYAYTYNKFSANAGTGSGSVSADSLLASYFPSLLVEYEEKAGGDGYQYGKDTLLGWYRLDRFGGLVNNWKIKSDDSDQTATVDGKSYSYKNWQVNATTPDNIVTFRFLIPGANVNANGVDLSAEQTKIDVQVSNYFDADVNKPSGNCDVTDINFSCASTGPSNNPNARLALVSFFATLSAQASVDFSGDISLHTKGGAITAALDWVSTVVVNGSISANVHTQIGVHTNSTEWGDFDVTIGGNGLVKLNANVLVQSFDAVRPNNILWDPVVGGQTNSAAVIIPSVTMLLLAVFALLF